MVTEKDKQVQQLAALIGTTNAELKQLDDHIVSTSTNLQQSNEAWNPEALLKQGMAELQVGLPGNGPVVPTSQPVPMAPMPESITQPQQGYAQPVPVQAHLILPPNIEARLDDIEKSLQQMAVQLEKFTDLEKKVSKFIQKGMDGRVKQITLKLDGPQNT